MNAGLTAGSSSPIKIKNYTSKALGPVNTGYVRTLKGKLHMMSVAVSNKVAVSKRKLSHNIAGLNTTGSTAIGSTSATQSFGKPRRSGMLEPTKAIHFSPAPARHRDA